MPRRTSTMTPQDRARAQARRRADTGPDAQWKKKRSENDARVERKAAKVERDIPPPFTGEVSAKRTEGGGSGMGPHSARRAPTTPP